MKTDTATNTNDLSQTPTQPIAFAYFNRMRPVAIDHYLYREGSDGFFPVMAGAALIAATAIMALD